MTTHDGRCQCFSCAGVVCTTSGRCLECAAPLDDHKLVGETKPVCITGRAKPWKTPPAGGEEQETSV